MLEFCQFKDGRSVIQLNLTFHFFKLQVNTLILLSRFWKITAMLEHHGTLGRISSSYRGMNPLSRKYFSKRNKSDIFKWWQQRFLKGRQLTGTTTLTILLHGSIYPTYSKVWKFRLTRHFFSQKKFLWNRSLANGCNFPADSSLFSRRVDLHKRRNDSSHDSRE